MFSMLSTAFVALVVMAAVRQAARTWGPPAALGLAAGLAAVWVVLPLGGFLALLMGVGALGFSGRERARLESSA